MYMYKQKYLLYYKTFIFSVYSRPKSVAAPQFNTGMLELLKPADMWPV